MRKITKQAALALDSTPIGNFGVLERQGEVGIEIECEGQNLVQRLPRFWVATNDPSLRGEACEYILAQPIERNQVREALDLLATTLKQNGSIVKDTYRTSVHVHINQKDLVFRQIFTEICLYLIVENLLMDFCGKNRIGNLFCLRACDAEYLLDALRDAASSGRYNSFNDMQTFKYGAVNIAACGKYGSLEYRAFRGTTNPDLISKWVNILLCIKDAHKQVENPQELVALFSGLSPEKFIRKFFDPDASEILLANNNIKERLYEGVRFAQEVAFAIPSWDKYVEKPKKDEEKLKYGTYKDRANKADLGAFIDAMDHDRRVNIRNPGAQFRPIIMDDVVRPEPRDDEDF